MRGDLYHLSDSIYLLQAGSVISGKVGVLTATDIIKCQNVPGCDSIASKYLVRANVKTYCYDIMVMVLRLELLNPALLINKVATFSQSQMDDIKQCALKHGMIPSNLFSYF